MPLPKRAEGAAGEPPLPSQIEEDLPRMTGEQLMIRHIPTQGCLIKEFKIPKEWRASMSPHDIQEVERAAAVGAFTVYTAITVLEELSKTSSSIQFKSDADKAAFYNHCNKQMRQSEDEVDFSHRSTALLLLPSIMDQAMTYTGAKTDHIGIILNHLETKNIFLEIDPLKAGTVLPKISVNMEQGVVRMHLPSVALPAQPQPVESSSNYP